MWKKGKEDLDFLKLCATKELGMVATELKITYDAVKHRLFRIRKWIPKTRKLSDKVKGLVGSDTNFGETQVLSGVHHTLCKHPSEQDRTQIHPSNLSFVSASNHESFVPNQPHHILRDLFYLQKFHACICFEVDL